MNPRYRATARRHRVLFVLIILLCALFGLSTALGSPKLYRSNATMVFKSLDTGASQFGATPPAAQNQAMLNELLLTRNFPEAVARKSPLGAYLKTHTSMGSGPITLLIVSGSRKSSAVISLHSTNSVTRQGGSSSCAATGGAIPRDAAFSFASRSAFRSIPSSEVSLPGTRMT